MPISTSSKSSLLPAAFLAQWAEPESSPDFRLSGHSNSVNALAVGPNGSTLLSGGDDARLVVWNLHTGENIQEINCAFNGPVVSIAWIGNTSDQTEDCFVFGCMDGTLHVYERMDQNSCFVFMSLTEAHESTVESIAYDAHQDRIATVGGGSARIWIPGKDRSLKRLDSFAPRNSKFIARTAHFYDTGSCLIVTYMESHTVVCYRIEPLAVKWSKQIPTRIGHAVLDSESLFVSNLVNGVDQYTLPTMSRSQTISHNIIRNVPLQVAIGRGGKWLVVGGDDGYARVFDRRTRQFLRRLNHENDVLVQVVATHSNAEGGGLILTASSNPGDSTIRVWSIDEKAGGFCNWKGLKAATYSRLQKLLFLVMAFQAVCFICFLAMAISVINTHRATLLSEAFWSKLLTVPEPVPTSTNHAGGEIDVLPTLLPAAQKALSVIYL